MPDKQGESSYWTQGWGSWSKRERAFFAIGAGGLIVAAIAIALSPGSWISGLDDDQRRGKYFLLTWETDSLNPVLDSQVAATIDWGPDTLCVLRPHAIMVPTPESDRARFRQTGELLRTLADKNQGAVKYNWIEGTRGTMLLPALAAPKCRNE